MKNLIYMRNLPLFLIMVICCTSCTKNHISLGKDICIAGNSNSSRIYNSEIIMLSSDYEAQMSSFIITSSSGKVIVVDGGWSYDSEKLLKELSRFHNRVDIWLVTHADPDHTGALYNILKDYRDRITIDSIVYNFAEYEWYQENVPDTAYYVYLLKNLLQKEHTILPIKNESIYCDDIQIIPLNHRYECEEDSMNNSSIVYKVLIDNINILFLGDLGYEGGNILLKESGSELLESDIVQMAHHGQNGVSEEVYKLINPKIALWPCPIWLWTNYDGNGSLTTLETRKWMKEIGSINYISGYGDVRLKINDIKEMIQS